MKNKGADNETDSNCKQNGCHKEAKNGQTIAEQSEALHWKSGRKTTIVISFSFRSEISCLLFWNKEHSLKKTTKTSFDLILS